MAGQIELDAMRRAIALSALGLGTTSPNPPVGCVILDRAGRVVGQGYHQRKGEPHAEAHALVAAGDRAEGGTAVVTLEPCNHQGRTPACRQGLIDAGVARVVIAIIDPTSRGEGGAAALRAAGIDVEVGVLTDEARLVLGPWLDALTTGRPHVTWAYVVDDDDPAGPLGHSSPSVADHASLLRGRTDAVIFEDGHVEEGVPNSHGAGILMLDPKPLSAGPAAVLVSLHAGGVRTLLLSGGHRLVASFLHARLVDQAVAYAVSEPTASPPDPAIPATSRQFAPEGFGITRVEHFGDAVAAVCSEIKPAHRR